jgi:LPXTG-motif cell wall-anchored protein
MSLLRHYPVILGGASALVLVAGLLARRRRKTPDDRERERRQRITQHGRITDGNILDVQELALNGRGSAQMLIYQYDVAGVTYEASQDITYLRHQVDLYSCRLGLATSVKYDPHNPGDSIVVAESWTGLRK